MALRFTGSSAVGISTSASNDVWITLQSEYVAAIGDAFQFNDADNCDYFLQGELYAGGDGIEAGAGANDLDVTIGAGASINASGDGIRFAGNFIVDAGHDVVNEGSIVSTFGDGIEIRAALSTLVNLGAITADRDGASFFGAAAELTNHGTIAAGASGLAVTGDAARVINTGTISGSTGIRVVGDGGRIDNAGTITAIANGILVGGEDARLTNSGLVSADTGIFCSAGAAGTAETITVLNAGMVLGAWYCVQMDALEEDDVLKLVNSGELRLLDPGTGSVAVEGGIGDDVVRNSGVIEGTVALGAGDDLYRGADGVQIGQVDGGDGEDVIVGGDGDDDILGGDGDDELRGRAGDDAIEGDTGKDVIFGGAGNDLIGGGTRDDVIDGGRDDDTMIGGGGADVFVFGPDAGFDVITDYQDGTDRIDVSALDVQNFAALSAAITSAGADAFIDWSVLGGAGILQIEGAAGVLNGGDFIF